MILLEEKVVLSPAGDGPKLRYKIFFCFLFFKCRKLQDICKEREKEGFCVPICGVNMRNVPRGCQTSGTKWPTIFQPCQWVMRVKWSIWVKRGHTAGPTSMLTQAQKKVNGKLDNAAHSTETKQCANVQADAYFQMTAGEEKKSEVASMFCADIWRKLGRGCKFYQETKCVCTFSSHSHNLPHKHKSLQSFGHSSPRCCMWLSVWTSIPPGTKACVRSQLCSRWRWCRWSSCSHHRSSGLCYVRHYQKPKQRWSHGSSSPNRKKRSKIKGFIILLSSWG